MKKDRHVIKEIYPGPIAEEMEIGPGDILVSINSEVIRDVFNYRYLIRDRYIEVITRKPNEEKWLLEIGEGYDDDLGMEFENGLMSDYRSYSNKCIFCFIDQMSSGMWETLYPKDDDSRLSFLQGNYIILTNMKERDIERVIHMWLAPINISVQATNPQLRCKILHNRFADDKLKYLQILCDGHVEMNGQVICYKNVNDGAELKRTIEDLSKCLPFLGSVSVVPAGITKFGDRLFPTELHTKEEAGAVIDMAENRQQGFYGQYDLHFIHTGDEWYITAGRDFLEEERYDDYIQPENGAGMTRMFISEFSEALEDVVNAGEYRGLTEAISRTLTITMGKLIYFTICGFMERPMAAFPRLTVHVYFIRNDFFGETITISDPITKQDLIRQLKGRQDADEDLREVLQIPSNMLRVGEQVSLDDLTVQDMERELGAKVVAVESGGREFIDAILDPEHRAKRKNDSFVHIRVYDRNKETQ